MSNVIDFHTHILPKIDDGSKSVAESIEMLKTEAVSYTHLTLPTMAVV